MLRITIPAAEFFDDNTQTFIVTKQQTLQLEHSLVSLSKWESKWRKPFISRDHKTSEETIDYIRCMTLTQNVDPAVYMAINNDIIEQVNKYIEEPMTATWFKEDKNRKSNRETITSEVIYHWMIALQIPFECQKWHLNKLLTLIQVCNEKNAPPKKQKAKDLMGQYHSINQARRKALHTKG